MARDEAEKPREVMRRCAARGVGLKWFGAPEPAAFTSRYDSWRYVDTPSLPGTDLVLAGCWPRSSTCGCR